MTAAAPASRRLPDPLPRKLNLGCGRFPRDGFLNVDVEATAKADLLVDLDDFGAWQVLPAGHFDLVVMDHCIEHLDDVFGVMKQVHRLTAPGGRVEIRVPHSSRGITHPEHQHGFDVTFPEYVRPGFAGYIGVELELVSMRFDYMIRFDLKRPFLKPWQETVLKGMNALISAAANAEPYLCSRFWCYWLGGFEQIEFVFRKPGR